jgi:hypothetical protein
MIGTDAFQEADITGITLPITKHNYLVKDVTELPRVIREAFFIASTGRRGPVLIDLPKDVQAAELEYKYPAKIHIPGYNPTFVGHRGQINRAVKALQRRAGPSSLPGAGWRPPELPQNCCPGGWRQDSGDHQPHGLGCHSREPSSLPGHARHARHILGQLCPAGGGSALCRGRPL